MIYFDSLENITALKLEGFFIGWKSQPSPQTHLKLLQNSDEFIVAVDDSKTKW